MNKKIVLAFVCMLCALLLLTSCTGQKKVTPIDEVGQPDIEHGVLVKKNEDGKQWLITQYNENNEYGSVRAIWFNIADDALLENNKGKALAADDFQVGHQVNAWSTGPINESYPEQARAAKIVLLSDDQAQSSTPITESMAIRAALDSANPTFAGGIKSATLVDAAGFWKVEVVDGGHNEQVSVFLIDAQNGDVIREPIAENEAFRIFTPAPLEEVKSTFVVMGEARVFEAMFHWMLEDGHNILAEGNMMADQGAPEWGQFEFEVNFNNVSNTTLSLIFNVFSAKDGSVEHQLIIPLKVPIEMIERTS